MGHSQFIYTRLGRSGPAVRPSRTRELAGSPNQATPDSRPSTNAVPGPTIRVGAEGAGLSDWSQDHAPDTGNCTGLGSVDPQQAHGVATVIPSLDDTRLARIRGPKIESKKGMCQPSRRAKRPGALCSLKRTQGQGQEGEQRTKRRELTMDRRMCHSWAWIRVQRAVEGTVDDGTGLRLGLG